LLFRILNEVKGLDETILSNSYSVFDRYPIIITSYHMEKTFSIFILDPQKGILPQPIDVQNEVGKWYKEFLSERHAEKVIERLMNEYDYNGSKYIILPVYSKE